MFMRVIFTVCAFIAMMSDSWCAVGRSSAAAAAANANNPNAAFNYSYMYPYMNNQMRADLNPGGVTPSLGSNPINAVVTTRQLGQPRRIVARSAVTSPANSAARSAGSAANSADDAMAAARVATAAANSAARSAQSAQSGATNTKTRRIVARSATNGGGVARAATQTGTRTVARGSARGDATQTNRIAANVGGSAGTAVSVSSSRCLADYTECMNGYCERADTAYNRCYCSAKLSQIDSKYQSEIDSLIRQIIAARGTNKWTDAEMNEYWMNAVGQYSGGNSWQNLDDALNIDWAALESRVRGQQAFATGHSYCVQHLRACYYMASNLRDAYMTEISRDCAAYETSLQKLKNAAETMLEMYK